jgi:hypothetical protein
MWSASHRCRAALAGVVLLLALWLVPPAGALRLLSPTGDPAVARYQRWVDAAAVPTPHGNLNVVFATCPLAISDGCIVHDAVPTVYLGPMVRDRATLLHEVGHAFDAAEMTDADRAAFSAIIGDTRPWQAAPNSPKERFAEAYSLCARQPVIRRTYTAAYLYRVTPAQHRRVCGLIRRIGS